MTRPTLLLLPAFAVGCKNLPQETGAPPAEVLLEAPGAAAAVQMEPAIGAVPVQAWVRAVDEEGVPVAADEVELEEGGEPRTVPVDDWGYGQVEIDEPASVPFTVDGVEVVVHAVDSPWQGIDAMPAEVAMPAALEAVGLSGGALVRTEQSLWWTGAGGPSHVVMEEAGDLLGMLAADLDADGSLDAVVWSAERVLLLRGRPGGGLGRGPTLVREGLGVVAVAAGDPSGDGELDLVVAYAGMEPDTGGAGHSVVVLEGDGALGFSGPSVELGDAPLSVAVGDNAGTGVEQISVLVETGAWVRLELADGSYGRTTPGTVELLPEGYTLRSGGDLNGDGADELYALGPYVPGASRSLVAYDIDEGVTRIEIEKLEAHYAFGDADSDGRQDVFMLRGDGTLEVLHYSGTDYLLGATGLVDRPGVPAASDVTGDGLLDLLIAGADGVWRWVPGERDDEGRWRPADPVDRSLAIEPLGPLAPVGGAGLRWASIEEATDELRVVEWSLSAEDGLPVRQGEVKLVGTEARDLQVCGNIAWALTDTGVYAGDLETGELVALAELDGQVVACGDGPSGAVAAVVVGDAVQLLDDAAGLIAEEAAEGAEDLLLSDGELHSCSTTGCALAAWQPTAELSGVVVGDAQSLVLETPKQRIDLGAMGHPSTADMDGDGQADLLAVGELGLVTVYRSTGSAIGPAEAFHSLVGLQGALAVGDGTGDGLPDAVCATSDGGLVLLGSR